MTARFTVGYAKRPRVTSLDPYLIRRELPAMTSSRSRAKLAPIILDHEDAGFPWRALGLFISCLALFFEIIPDAWWSTLSFASTILSYLDVRGWTWHSYTGILAVTIIFLVFIRARQENA